MSSATISSVLRGRVTAEDHGDVLGVGRRRALAHLTEPERVPQLCRGRCELVVVVDDLRRRVVEAISVAEDRHLASGGDDLCCHRVRAADGTDPAQEPYAEA